MYSWLLLLGKIDFPLALCTGEIRRVRDTHFDKYI